MLAMYLARKHTGAAYSEIGRFFGDRNHSTVISADKKVRSCSGPSNKTPSCPALKPSPMSSPISSAPWAPERDRPGTRTWTGRDQTVAS